MHKLVAGLVLESKIVQEGEAMLDICFVSFTVLHLFFIRVGACLFYLYNFYCWEKTNKGL